MRRSWLALILLGGCGAPAVASAAEPALPVWNEGERAAWVPGAGLITAETQPPPVEPLGIGPPGAEEIAATPGQEIPAKFWQDYFAQRPATFLLDPQGLLEPGDFRQRLEFLQDHAGDSAVDLFVYVFQGDQELPGEVRAEEVAERLFSAGRPAVMVYYYLGAPQRTAWFLSPALSEVVPAAEQRRALENSVMQAVEKSEPSRQFETLLVQMSIRIYWMERMLGGGVAVKDAPPVVVRKPKSTDKKFAALEKLRPLIERARGLLLPAAVIAGILVVSWALGVWLRRRARYRFPLFGVEPRLGAARAAGVGAVISFASSAVSPAAQRDQRPEDLSRA